MSTIRLICDSRVRKDARSYLLLRELSHNNRHVSIVAELQPATAIEIPLLEGITQCKIYETRYLSTGLKKRKEIND